MREGLALASRSNANLLIGGPSVQKEWIARLVHHRGLRAAAPFVAKTCSTA
jgi:DNA-binding NtrC family response regulator